jgi:two-component system NtrC family sensor kinase
VRFPALGEAATQLPWLCPCASSLLALARKPAAAAWAEVRDDPGAVLLIVRQSARVLGPGPVFLSPMLLRDSAILKGAIRLLSQTGSAAHTQEAQASGPASLTLCPPSALDRSHSSVHDRFRAPSGFVDWRVPGARPLYHACLAYAHAAQRIAELSQRCDPSTAWVAGLLAPLGWLAICAVSPEDAAACLADPAFPQDPVATQHRRWGYDHAGIARRLARRWRLPDWLAVVVGHLALPDEISLALGAESDLLHVVQLAVGMVQQGGQGLRLTVGAEPPANAGALGLSLTDLSERAREWESESVREWESESVREFEREGATEESRSTLPHSHPPPLSLSHSPRRWTPPHALALLHDLLTLAAENLTLRDAPTIELLECERDRLHQALERQRHGEAEKLQGLKLNALAEFAAGAAHEINNPLAVISGQAQYLLGREVEPARQRALQTINGQAHRIHQLLNELMQFARPPRVQKQPIDLRGLLREVALSLSDLAAQRQVQLVCPDADPSLTLQADIRLLRTALECLLRNAIEAAPAGGWAGIRVVPAATDRVEFIIEDNGNGPAPSQRDHLFDPFYSGRLAGRGRGFGLPTAWRLAREHGGDVRFDRPADGPTRFIVDLPREAWSAEREARTA